MTATAPAVGTRLEDLLAQAQTANQQGDAAEVDRLLALAREQLAWGLPDAMTGLPGIAAWAEIERRHPPRDGTTLAVLFVDLDGLKRVNDTRGHAAGDAYICRAARALQAVCRADDRIATRKSGDEFVCFGPGVRTDRDVARFAARVEQALVRAQIPASVGGVRQQPGEALEAAVARADQAMYRAKEHHHERGRTR